jgi:hypothetical protein
MAGNFGLCEGDHRRAFYAKGVSASGGDFGKFSFVRLFFSKRKVAKLPVACLNHFTRWVKKSDDDRSLSTFDQQ